MKTRLMKTMSALLAVVMLLGMLPMAAFAVDSDTVVTSVEINDPVQLNVAYTEKQIYQALGKDYYLAPEDAGYFVDPSNSFLMYYVTATGNMMGTYEEAALSTEKDYYINLTLYTKDGYDWPSGIKTNDTPDFTGFTVTVGEQVVDFSAETTKYYYNDYWNCIDFCVSAGDVSTAGIITSVSVDPATKSMAKGESFTFTAAVEGTADDKSVAWVVAGNNSANTVIDEDGKLTVGADETAVTLTVKAISAIDDTKVGLSTVTVLDAAPVINITGVPETTSLYPNDATSIGAYVTGTETNRELKWTLTGNADPETTITVWDMYKSSDAEWFQSCTLEIGNNETAETITLTVSSVAQPEVVKTTVITILPATQLADIKLVLNPDAAALDTTKTEGDMKDIIYGNLFFAGSGFHTGSVYLMYLNDGVWNGIGDGTKPVDLEKTYGVEVSIGLYGGYKWPAGVLEGDFSGLNVILNDVPVKVEKWHYSSYYNEVQVLFVPKLVDAELIGASLTLGSDLALNYNVEVYDEEDVDTSKLAVKFNFDGDDYLIKNYTKEGDVYSFKFPGIAPQQMMDEIDAQLVLLGDGDTVAKVLDVKNNYSVKDYLVALKAENEDPEIDQLIDDIAAYGQAAQIYMNYNPAATPVDHIIGCDPSEALPADSDKMVVTGNTDAKCKIVSAGVRFDVVNKVFIKVYSETDTFKIIVDGVEYTVADCELVAENTYKLYLEPLTAPKLGKRYAIELKNGEAETVATLNYGAYAYVKAVYDDAGAEDAQKALALALYRYGQSAAALLD